MNFVLGCHNFYSGLLSLVKDSIDAALGKTLIDKTPFEARKLSLGWPKNLKNFLVEHLILILLHLMIILLKNK